jgi:hypothetical protein
MGTLLALDLRDYLSSGLGAGETVTAGRLAAVPDRHVGVVESGGLPSTHTMAPGPGLAQLEWPRAQVLTRATTYQAAAQLATNVHRLLDGFRPRTINGTVYEWIEAVQQPFFLEDDANGRVVFACNYQIAKALSTSTST